MKRISGWHAVEWIARALDPNEREAVLGDLAESGEAWHRRLGEILGLVIRREAALWKSPRVWIILVAVVVPLGLLVSVSAALISGETRVYVWMYANNWDWALVRNAGFWHVFSEASVIAGVKFLTLGCWAWTIGFVIGTVSGKVFRSSAFALLLVLLAGGFSLAPRYLAFCWQLRNELFHAPALPQQSDPISPIWFYRVMFPLMVQLALVAAPALWGLVAGRSQPRSRILRVCVWIVAIASVISLVLREPGFGLLFYRHSSAWLSQETYLLYFVVYWPIVYLLAGGIQKRLQPRAA